MSKKQFDKLIRDMTGVSDHYPDCPNRDASLDCCDCWERHIFEAGKRAGIHAEKSRVLELQRPKTNLY